MQNNEFHKKYRELLEQDVLQAPDDVWMNISEALDTDALPVEPNDEEQALIDKVWGGIANELDVDEVWDTISGQLDEEAKRPVYIRYSRWLAAAVIALLIGVGGILQIFTPEPTQPRIAKMHQYNKQGHQPADEVQNSDLVSAELLSDEVDVSVTDRSQDELSPQENTNETYIATLLRDEPGVKTSNTIHPNEESSTIACFPIPASGSFSLPQLNTPLEGKAAYIQLPDGVNINRAASLRQYRHPNTYWMADFAPVQALDDEDELLHDRRDSRWTTGVVTAVKNTYLLNQETLDGFSPAGMNNASLAFMPDVGLNLQYAINRRYVLESNVFVSSNTKQSYNFYSYGEYVSKDMQLQYLATELLLKQNARRSYFKDKLIRRNVAGVYVAHMQSASEQVGSEVMDVSSKYASFDYGLMLGQELELRSSRPVKVSTGITIKYGLPNVYVGDAQVPGQFNKTHNASIEFRVGIAYRWKAKAGIDHYLGFNPKKRRE
ncbi:hypothetical protein KDU71_14315 [Carboxylicivirga sediminis]|uniref:Outer membrane protein beta-barrel domain-containing protein n=1 Tax=Carboxylicivirga sediminis TaxID=2006564 RepID=A0A941F5H9_9BACT|nr:hypothetical protein [Carboxylicivirga sediminis]MBR8536747.1 hypothetical protein [Carboxylicivirga sediminis]